VYKEGEPNNFVYIIKNGEFEVTKRLKTEEKKEIDIASLVGGGSDSNHTFTKVTETLKASRDNNNNSPYKMFRDTSEDRTNTNSLKTVFGAKDEPVKKKRSGTTDDKIGSFTNSKIVSNVTKNYATVRVSMMKF
jgi:hypothetical protein